MKAPVLVLGATGVVGRGIVKAAVDAATPVIAVARDAVELERLRASHAGADLTVVAGSVSGDADSAELARALRALDRPLAGVVVAVSGGSGRGRLLDHPVDMLRRQLDEDLLPHLAAARHLLPLLSAANRGGSYVLIGGPGGELPWAGYGHRSVAASAQRMLACVLHDEARALGVRVQLLAIDMPVCSDHNRAHACPQWPSAVDIGRRALELVACDATGEPTRAIVQYAARKRRTSSSTTTDVQTAAAPDPDSGTTLLPARCLQDARKLLRTLIFAEPGPLNSNQEGTPP